MTFWSLLTPGLPPWVRVYLRQTEQPLAMLLAAGIWGLGARGRGEAHHPPRPCAVLPELAEAVCTGRRGLPGTPSISFFPTSLQNKRCLDSVLGQVCAQPPPSSALFAFRGALLYLGGFVGLLPAPFHSLVIILIRERGAKGSSLLPSVTSSEKTTNRLDGREA